ncbi:MAG: 30S ribosomal protein S20 [Candidatus Eremiobacteraeota bacterium]|nr:30S ribosomal protein S20 [Candidatus Eremiobacteraeota bacterium]
MPNIKAADKWVRQSEKRSVRNKDAKSRLKTIYKKAATGSGDPASAVESAFDKAAAKGIIHPNKAARKKSRLARAIAKAATAAPKPTKTKAAKAPKATAAKPAAKKASKKA